MKKLHSRECGFYEPARGFSVPSDFQIIRLGNYFLLSMLSIIPYSRASEDVIQ